MDKDTEIAIVTSVASAKSHWPLPWEGGSHLMRYIGAEVAEANEGWRHSEDMRLTVGDNEQFRLNPNDARSLLKIVGAVTRFMEQVGAEKIAMVAKQ